ncbi:unnamed protein product [Trichobilharzia regenti]|nr:unnamed protein product [Trichobilharzia regenti]
MKLEFPCESSLPTTNSVNNSSHLAIPIHFFTSSNELNNTSNHVRGKSPLSLPHSSSREYTKLKSDLAGENEVEFI